MYQYDALQRLVSAVTVGPQWGMSWVYDGFGNRTAQNVVKGSVPVQSVSVDMATNRVSSWSYDANGNATSIPGVGGITYDASNRVKTVGGETYEYDPSNKRIWKNDTYTFWGARGERVGTYTVVLMAYLPEGQTTQQYQLSFVKGTEDWYFGGRRLQVLDRLGSANGTFYPYGEERTSAVGNPADKFATYHRDGTGLDYADQRYYHAGSGRFVTSDPYGGSAMEVRPSSWNRFIYVEGDPVNAGDPDGRQTVYYQGIPYCQHGGEGGPWWPCGPGVVPDAPQPEAPNCEAHPSAPGCPGGVFVAAGLARVTGATGARSALERALKQDCAGGLGSLGKELLSLLDRIKVVDARWEVGPQGGQGLLSAITGDPGQSGTIYEYGERLAGTNAYAFTFANGQDTIVNAIGMRWTFFDSATSSLRQHQSLIHEMFHVHFGARDHSVIARRLGISGASSDQQTASEQINAWIKDKCKW